MMITREQSEIQKYRNMERTVKGKRRATKERREDEEDSQDRR